MILDEGAVRALSRTEELIPAMERALGDLSAGKVVQPVRTMLPVAEQWARSRRFRRPTAKLVLISRREAGSDLPASRDAR